jgi:hypothetical protein
MYTAHGLTATSKRLSSPLFTSPVRISRIRKRFYTLEKSSEALESSPKQDIVGVSEVKLPEV